MIFFAVLLLLSIPLYIASIALSASMQNSDAAGNGLSQSFAYILTAALWAVLGTIVISATAQRELDGGSVLVAGLLVTGGAAAAFAAIKLLTDRLYRSRWPLSVLVVLPPLVAALATGAYFPELKLAQKMDAEIIATLIAIVSVLPWPVLMWRARHRSHDEQVMAADWADGAQARVDVASQQNRHEFAGLTADSNLEEWLPFLSRSNELRANALAGIRSSPRRQADAERLLANGCTYFWEDLPLFDLTLTPVIAECGRRFIRERAMDIAPLDSSAPPNFLYTVERIEPYVPTLRWLVDQHCDCRAELIALSHAVQLYPESQRRNHFLGQLTELRTSLMSLPQDGRTTTKLRATPAA